MRNITESDMLAMGFVKQSKPLPSKQTLEETIFVLEYRKAHPNATERVVKRAFKRRFGANQLPQINIDKTIIQL